MRATNIAIPVLVLFGCLPTSEPRPPEAAVPPAVVRDERPHAPVFDDPVLDSVWGFADLHAHVAAHLAFGGDEQGRGGFVYGDPSTTAYDWRTIRLAEGETCDGETHLPASRDQIQRETQALVFGFIQGDANYAHGPMIAREDADDPTHFHGWPHGSDVLHQQMHVESIRRAYDGGLRLMFASVSENQTLTGISGFTLGPEPIEIDPAVEVESAIRQIEHIRALVQGNSDWMQIVTTPAQAREAIESNHLAIVLSLELDWLSLDDVRRLYDEYQVRHIIPIHLADNPVGGTASFSDIFNAHSALYSRAFGADEFAFQHVEPAACIDMHLGQPLFAAYTAGIVLLPQPLGGDAYGALGYESCDRTFPPDGPMRLPAWGHRNAGGLGDVGYLRELMRLGMIVDVSHMSMRSAADTLLEASAHDYPLIASHSGIVRDGAVANSDRALPLALARRIYEGGGIVGLGTRGVYAAERVLFSARNSPLVELQTGERERILDRTPNFTERERALGTADATRICVRFAANEEPAEPYWLRVHGCDRTVARYELEMLGAESCFGEGEAYCTRELHIPGGVERAVLEVGPSAGCDRDDPATADIAIACAGGAGRTVVLTPRPAECTDVEMNECALHVVGAVDLVSRSCDCTYECSLDEPESTFARCNEPPLAPAEPDGRVQADEDFSVVRVRARASGELENRVQGTSPFYQGTDVRVTLDFGGAVGVREVSLNRRGAWTGPNELAAYLVVRHSGPLEPLSEVTVALESDDARALEFRIDEIVVEIVPDPLFRWAEDYAQLRSQIAPSAAGGVVFALGTDANGLFPQFPTSGLETSPDGSPLRVGLIDGEDVELHFEQRGLATYGMLADVIYGLEDADRIAGRGPGAEPPVAGSVLSSAEATLRTWAAIEEAARSLR